jgi:hypothetical protein
MKFKNKTRYFLVIILLANCCISIKSFTINTSKTKNLIQKVVSSDTSLLRTRAKSSTIESLRAWPISKDPKGVAPDYPLAASRVSITIFATFLTWWAQKQYSNVLASSAITLICSICFDRRLGQAAFCGTFAGMSSRAVIPTWQGAVGLGALTSILFEWLIHKKNMFYGVGGRLGMIAFIATNIVAALINVPTGMSMSSFQSLLSSLKKTTLIRFACWHALGSVATIALREASDDSAAADPVRASAVVGLMGALLLEDKVAALAIYGGSFVGMSLPSRLLFGIIPGKEMENKSRTTPTFASLFVSYGIAGALGGLIHGATVSWGLYAGGWGGKAGFCAFIGCLIFRIITKIIP